MGELNRRSFLRHTAMAGGAVLALEGLMASNKLRSLSGGTRAYAQTGSGGYGPLIPQAANNTGETLLRLPAGFQYTVIGKRGALMGDGRVTPGAHDGMAAYDVNGMIHLVRNHEQSGGAPTSEAIGSMPYDPKATGGTTTVVVDPVTRELVYDFVSLSGTVRNCAGGQTPWGSWLTCEETTLVPASNNSYTQPHGYVFDAPAGSFSETAPVALTAMGRFSHEAVTVDPATGIIYETEDANPGGFYRFIPNHPGFVGQPPNLAAGGVLQMLKVRNQFQYDTRTNQTVGQELEVEWVTIANPNPLGGQTSVANQGIALGAAQFERLEGAWYDGNGSHFFVSTSGGNANLGQIWQFTPTGADTGILKLFYEPTDAAMLESPDNLLVTPRGGLVLCEDGGGLNYVRGLTQNGLVFDFAVHALSNTEAAGATFSRDGQTLFFNYQGTGETYAVWPRAGTSWEDGAL